MDRFAKNTLPARIVYDVIGARLLDTVVDEFDMAINGRGRNELASFIC